MNDSRSLTFGMRLLTWCIMLLVVLSAGVAYQRYETSFFPVITNFDISTVDKTQDGVIIEGVMNKRRQCEFVEIGMYAFLDADVYGTPVPFEFLDSEPIETRSTLQQRWGPWRVDIPYEYEKARVEVWAIHQCNELFQTHSLLNDFTVMNQSLVVDAPEGVM